ncbi:MAG: histidine kinase [Actinobacteria bacterium]|uniref:histidine kinase n=1 Tax=Candidatus Fonsibacter lacus TaxID=2576439 RepID=A0A965GCK1_9PROT|nr:histidine kinase [Candidatus Fonsibacter lacus]
MAALDELTAKSTLNGEEINRLRAIISEWQLLADLSFADLLLWVPLRENPKSWPEGHVVVGQMRPTTAATVYAKDLVGQKVRWGERPWIDAALSDGEIQRDTEPEPVGELLVKEECIPILHQSKVIGVIARYRNVEQMRSPGRLELTYREAAFDLARMISEGTFPAAKVVTETTPRVGDGLIRLDSNGMISFSSPNAISAFRQIGYQEDLELGDLGEILESLSLGFKDRFPRDESWHSILSGKIPRQIEYENSNGVLDLYVLPLTAGNDRVGALVLVHNVTEIRRRERELISKDATIREIHHRVKNNLQTVSALLRLQTRRAEDPSAASAIEEAIRRIGSIALVHEMLSTTAQEMVEFDEVADRLISAVRDVSTLRPGITLERIGKFGALHPETATPLALILTELIHNAYEHGLANTGSKLSISVKRQNDQLTLEVSDDGIGLPSGFDIQQSGSLGLQIVKTLTTNELGGKIEVLPAENGGTRIHLEIYC